MNENTEKNIAEADQAMETLRRFMPQALKSFFDSFIEQGFLEHQAMVLTVEYMKILLGANNAHPPNTT